MRNGVTFAASWMEISAGWTRTFQALRAGLKEMSLKNTLDNKKEICVN